MAGIALFGSRLFRQPFSEGGHGRVVSLFGEILIDPTGRCFPDSVDGPVCIDRYFAWPSLGKGI